MGSVLRSLPVPGSQKRIAPASMTEEDLIAVGWMFENSGGRTHPVGFKSLADQPRLGWIHLRGSDLSDAGLQRFKALPHLKSLNFRGTNVTRAGGRGTAKGVARVRSHRGWCQLKIFAEFC